MIVDFEMTSHHRDIVLSYCRKWQSLCRFPCTADMDLLLRSFWGLVGELGWTERIRLAFRYPTLSMAFASISEWMPEAREYRGRGLCPAVDIPMISSGSMIHIHRQKEDHFDFGHRSVYSKIGIRTLIRCDGRGENAISSRFLSAVLDATTPFLHAKEDPFDDFVDDLLRSFPAADRDMDHWTIALDKKNGMDWRELALIGPRAAFVEEVAAADYFHSEHNVRLNGAFYDSLQGILRSGGAILLLGDVAVLGGIA